jgi:hypothetical protein
MKTLILSLVLFLTLSCNNDDNNSNASFISQTITPNLIYKGGFSSFTYNPTQHGEIITTQTDWDNFRNTHWLNGLQLTEANNINFSNQMVILAFDAPKTTTSGTLEVYFGTITENTDNILVPILYSGQAGLGQMPSRVCNFIKIPKSTKPVVFQ